MNLNKDNKDIYTVDSTNYSEYMADNWKEPRDPLSSFIKFLLFILLFVVLYFSYYIIKTDLSFSEVFNKKEFLSTYGFLSTNETVDNSLRVEFEEPKEIVALAVTEKHVESVVEKEAVKLIKEVIAEEKVIELEKPKAVEIIEEIKEEKIVESVVFEIVTNKEVVEETTLSENYLDLMVEELNSL